MQIAHLYLVIQQLKKLQSIENGLVLAKAPIAQKYLPPVYHIHPRQLFAEGSSQNSANRVGFIPYKRARLNLSRPAEKQKAYESPEFHTHIL